MSVLGKGERGETPQFGRVMEHKEMAQLILLYDDETEELLKTNPNLNIIGNRPDRQALIDLHFPN